MLVRVFARKNVPYLILGFFVLLFGSLFATSQFATYYTQSGLDAYKQGNYSAAEVHFGRAESLDPHNAVAPFYLGLCFLHDGQSKSALEEFKTVCTTVEDKKYASPPDRQLESQSEYQIKQINSKP